MPTHRLSNGEIDIGRSDVVGCDADGAKNFIRHVALAACGYPPEKSGGAIKVNHMGPPLERDGEIKIDAVATAKLNNDELNQVNLFIDEHFLEHQANGVGLRDSYIILPHTEFGPDRSFRRFSCTGFVVEAYRDAGLLLLNENAGLPEIDLETLLKSYPDFRGREKLIERYGIKGSGPWPVLLPGYIFHSLARDADAIRANPYTVAKGDECFPRHE